MFVITNITSKDSIFLSAFIVTQCELVTSYNLADAANLEDDLKAGYYRTLRPTDSTQVGIEAGLFHISSLV